MSDDVKVRIRSLKELIPDSTRVELLRRAAATAIGVIKRRTSAGFDVDGAPFVPYSQAYAARLEAAGQGSSTPDLWLTGSMLGSMTILDVTPARALIGFQGSGPQVRFKSNGQRRKRTKTTQLPAAAKTAPARKKARNASQTAGGGTSWRDFVKARMGTYMKTYGSHGAAMKQIGQEWRARGSR